MLVELTPIKSEQARYAKIAKDNNFEIFNQDHPDFVLEKGIYRCSCDHNFSKGEFEETESLKFSQEYEIFAPNYEKDCYGVADSIVQIKHYYKEEVADPEKKYIICVTPVFQDLENKGKGGGWRWHKWGEYIGQLDSKCQYLDDEDFGEGFEYVLCFSIILIK